MSEKLIVYGANCAWWDSIDNSGMLPGTLRDPTRPRSGLPCCPHCKSVLYQTPEARWFKGMQDYEIDHPGYTAMMEWGRGKCFKNMAALRKAYDSRNSTT